MNRLRMIRVGRKLSAEELQADSLKRLERLTTNTPMALVDKTPARAEVCGAETMSEWQSIETAPKDGTRILLFGPYCHGPAMAVTGKWVSYTVNGEHTGCWFANGVKPTHWMPLPEPPQ